MSEDRKPTLPKPINYDDLYPGRFMKAASLKGRDVTLTIAKVETEWLEGERGEKVKAILTFRERSKLGMEIQYVPGKTVGECLKAMFGKRLDDWIGKRVTFFPTTAKLSGEEVDAIRVRGSPDIKETFTFTLKLPRKKAQLITLQKTGAKAASEKPTAEAPTDAKQAPVSASDAAPTASTALQPDPAETF